jgi:hypothetical protein
MRALRALLVASTLGWVLATVPIAPRPSAAQQLGAVTVDRDGWWDRASDPGRPIGSPGLPFPVPANALAVSASGGEPDKVAAVGVLLDVEPELFQRLILNVTEASDPGSNVGSSQGAIQACAITGSWTSTKGGDWANRPAADLGDCVDGVRSSDAVWRFDLSTFARRWLDGSLAANGVLLIEKVDPPSTFQVAVGDRSTSTMTFLVDVTHTDDEATTTDAGSGDSSSSAAGSGDATSTGDDGSAASGSLDDASASDQGASDTFVYSGGDAFTVPAPAPQAEAVPDVARPAQPASTSRGTDLARPITRGRLPLATVLLIPIAIALALAMSASLGESGDGVVVAGKREGGVSRVMRQRKDQED